MRAIGQGRAEVLKEPVSELHDQDCGHGRGGRHDNRLMAEMTTRRFRHMPVVEKDRLIGLVSIGDLVKIRSRKSTWRRPQRGSTPLSLVLHQASRLREVANEREKSEAKSFTKNPVNWFPDLDHLGVISSFDGLVSAV